MDQWIGVVSYYGAGSWRSKSDPYSGRTCDECVVWMYTYRNRHECGDTQHDELHLQRVHVVLRMKGVVSKLPPIDTE